MYINELGFEMCVSLVQSGVLLLHQPIQNIMSQISQNLLPVWVTTLKFVSLCL